MSLESTKDSLVPDIKRLFQSGFANALEAFLCNEIEIVHEKLENADSIEKVKSLQGQIRAYKDLLSYKPHDTDVSG